MRFLEKTKDGGPLSPVTAYFLIEIKPLFSIALLKFNPGARDNFHTHAFHALTFFLKGDMGEYIRKEGETLYKPYKDFSFKITPRSRLHRVKSWKTSWALSFRGPWTKTWTEETPEGETIILTNGRKVLDERP